MTDLKDMRRLRRRVLRQLVLHGRLATEGSSSAEELLYLAQHAKGLVGEIGFNVGLSSNAILAHSDATVVSFDLGDHRGTLVGKELIDKNYPGRHELILGDSRETVPAFDGGPFDMVFIDGGHDYETAKADIMNMRELSSPSTVVIIDDLVPWEHYGAGPTKAWNEAIDNGFVVQHALFVDGRQVDKLEPPGVRAWASGSYKKD